MDSVTDSSRFGAYDPEKPTLFEFSGGERMCVSKKYTNDGTRTDVATESDNQPLQQSQETPTNPGETTTTTTTTTPETIKEKKAKGASKRKTKPKKKLEIKKKKNYKITAMIKKKKNRKTRVTKKKKKNLIGKRRSELEEKSRMNFLVRFLILPL